MALPHIQPSRGFSSQMSPERWRRLEEVFQSALDTDPEVRPAFLRAACAGDEDLLREAQALLDRHSEASAFIESPAIADFHFPEAHEDFGDTLIGQQVGPYRIEKEIGRGGMGAVYRAVRVDGAFDQDVAVKVIKRGFETPELLERFRRERQILAMMNHPNIARILDGGSTADGRPYYVMDLVDGAPITRHCFDRRLKLAQRLKLFADVCAAVGNAHQSLIIHRDLKPANILVTHNGVVKLLDFGIAKVFNPEPGDPDQTHTPGAPMLTPSYAAPEQVRGESITTATDIYALGLIPYEMLTGRKAQQVDSTSLLEIERTVCLTEPPRPSAAVEEGGIRPPSRLRGDLENIILKALQKEPARRYATVVQFAEDIERYRSGRTVIARPDSLIYRTTKFVRRNKLGVGAAAAAVLSLAAGIGVAVRQAQIARGHFDAVRGLAKSLVNEINPAITEVPGTTKARHLVVKRSLEYLDRLSNGARGNVELMTEMADAYETIGNIQGNRNKANLGDYAGAMASFRKAIDIRQRIEELSPPPGNRQWIALIEAEAARIYPGTDESLRLAKSAVEMAERLNRESPKEIYNFLLPNSLFGLGYIYGHREQPEDAIECFTKAREIFIAINRPKLNISVCDRYIAINNLMLRKPGVAEAHYRRALDVDEARFRQQPGPRTRMDLSYDHEGLAVALEAQGHWKEALEIARKAERVREELAAADPNDQRARLAMVDIRETLGLILSGFGSRTESLEYLKTAIAAREAFVQATPESPEDQSDLARTYLYAGIARRRLGLCREADNALERARAVFIAQNRKLSLARLEGLGRCR